MCGIIGITSKKKILAKLLSGLAALEYRGYDSAGVALVREQSIQTTKTAGKIKDLKKACQNTEDATCGIAHTRWATHGTPNKQNAHPHTSGDYAIVHNGIIENAKALKSSLEDKGFEFYSDTDSEVIAKLLDSNAGDIEKTAKALKGAYAIAAINSNKPGTIYFAKNHSPLIIGKTLDGFSVLSDTSASDELTHVFYCEDGMSGYVTTDDFELFCGAARSRIKSGMTQSKSEMIKSKSEVAKSKSGITNMIEFSSSNQSASKNGYSTFMEKEIHEQAKVLQQCIAINDSISLAKPDFIQIAACGTSYHAGLLAKYWFESLCGIQCSVDIASEFRYRQTIVPANSLFLCISQSGETADTLAALNKAKEINFQQTCCICNVKGSAMTRIADATILTHAGKEYGVASTKAFTTQLIALLKLVSHFATKPLKFDESIEKTISQTLAQTQEVQTLSKTLTHKNSMLYIARGELFPIALEGALKMKELSYIHAECYPAGELKHGPLALVDENMPVIALLSDDALFDKTLSNIEEVYTRGAKVTVFASEQVKDKVPSHLNMISLPKVSETLMPIIFTLPMQLLAFYTASEKGLDVDQPRNLAKSVTVE